MNTEQQAKIKSILNKVKIGEIVPETHPKCTSKPDVDYEQNLRYSLLEWGQLNPIYVCFDGLDKDNPIPQIVCGDVDLQVINKLREERLLKFEPIVIYRELINDQKPESLFAAANFIKQDFTALQKGMYGASYLYAGMRERARANQSAKSRTNTHIDTCKIVGNAVGCCDKVVRLAYRLLQEDVWFFDYIFTNKNNMSTAEAREFVLLADPVQKQKVLDTMKEMYAKECEAVQKTAETVEPEKEETEEIKEDDVLRRFFKKENAKSLYRRAREKVYNDDPVIKRKKAEQKVASMNGGNLPSKEQIQADFASQKANGKEGQPQDYVQSYGTGSRRIIVDFDCPELLAATFIQACKQYGIDAFLTVEKPKSELGETA